MNNHFLRTILCAFIIDRFFGEPANRYHPVAWMGQCISLLQRHAPKQGRFYPFCYGMASIIAGIGSLVGLSWILQRLLNLLPSPCRIVAEAVILKMTFSLRGLEDAATEVQSALDVENLPEARRALSWHLVSRDTSQLTDAEIAAATIESVAENASDGIIAPLFFYMIGGLPAALAYRFVNTADAMWGYRDEQREWLGKFPARLDDLLNLLPARFTALTLVLGALFSQANPEQAWRIWQRDHQQTDSPNAGHPMSAMAGALEVELAKTGQYQLGKGRKAPKAADVGRAIQLIRIATLLATALFTIIRWWADRRMQMRVKNS